MNNPTGRASILVGSSPSKKLVWVFSLGCLAIVLAVLVRRYFDTSYKMLPAALLSPQARASAEKAERAMEAIQKDPHNVQQRWVLADLYQHAGRLDLAAEQLEAITEVAPQDTTAYLALADVHLAKGEMPQAEKLYGKVAQQQPTSADAWQGIAVTLYHQARYYEASEAARKAVHLDFHDPNKHLIMGMCYVEFAMQYPNPQVRSPELRKAIQELQIALSVWPERGEIFYRLGRAAYGLRDLRSALKNLRRAREMLGDRQDVALQLANTFRVAGNLDEAKQVVEAGLKKNPNSYELHDLLAQLLQTSNEPKAQQLALEHWQQAIKLQPESALLRQKLGSAYMQAGNVEAAEAEFKSAIRIDPNRAFAYQQLARIYTRKGDVKQASFYSKIAQAANFNDRQLELLQAQSELHPDNSLLHLALGDRYRTLGGVHVARSEYLLALHLDPHNSRAQAGLAMLSQTDKVANQNADLQRLSR